MSNVPLPDTGVNSNDHSMDPSISDDGTRVVFRSTATNLDARDQDHDDDIYVKNVVTGDIVLASTSDAGVKSNQNTFDPGLSGDGTKVVLRSFATNLDAGNSDYYPWDILVKDLASGDITLASASDSGVSSNNDNGFPMINP